VWARKHADETRAREAREAAEKARKEAMDAVVPKRPWDVGIEMPRMSEILSQSRLFDSIAKQYGPTEYLPRIPGIPGSGEPPNPEPLSDEQIEAKVATYRSALESRWPSCRDYLAGIAWPALRCRIKNEAKSFLTDVEVILTFHGARGIDFEDLEDFEILKFQDPSQERHSDPYFTTIAPALRHIRPADYPIHWRHNDDGDLEATITLPRLRPLAEWRGDEYGEDIVLIVDPGANIESIKSPIPRPPTATAMCSKASRSLCRWRRLRRSTYCGK
jgi:hypothetical protein